MSNTNTEQVQPISDERLAMLESYAGTWARGRELSADILALVARMRAAEAEVERLRATGVLAEVAGERARQDAKWGEQNHPDGTGPNLRLNFDAFGYLRRHGIAASDVAAWATDRTDAAADRDQCTYEHILTEEWAEAIAEADPQRLRAELVQVAAVAVAWVEAIDRRAALADEEGRSREASTSAPHAACAATALRQAQAEWESEYDRVTREHPKSTKIRAALRMASQLAGERAALAEEEGDRG